MKKLRLLLLTAAAIMYTAVDAQTDGTFVFVDSEGNEVEDGSHINASTVEYIDDGMGGQTLIIPTGLSVKNTSSENCGVSLEIDVEKLDNGILQYCFPSSCNVISSTGTYAGSNGTMDAGQVKSFETEWIPVSYGECTASFKIKVMDVKFNDWGIPTYTFKAYGPTVKVTFAYSESSGINDAAADAGSEVVGYYTLGGLKTDAPHKGFNIVKYADGTSGKIFIK